MIHVHHFTFMVKERVMCDQCEAMMINGVLCHEHGCPDAWKEIRECRECGREFKPESREDQFCSIHCAVIYRGEINESKE